MPKHKDVMYFCLYIVCLVCIVHLLWLEQSTFSYTIKLTFFLKSDLFATAEYSLIIAILYATSLWFVFCVLKSA